MLSIFMALGLCACETNYSKYYGEYKHEDDFHSRILTLTDEMYIYQDEVYYIYTIETTNKGDDSVTSGMGIYRIKRSNIDFLYNVRYGSAIYARLSSGKITKKSVTFINDYVDRDKDYIYIRQ